MQQGFNGMVKNLGIADCNEKQNQTTIAIRAS
jgi:hypothetical protein